MAIKCVFALQVAVVLQAALPTRCWQTHVLSRKPFYRSASQLGLSKHIPAWSKLFARIQGCQQDYGQEEVANLPHQSTFGQLPLPVVLKQRLGVMGISEMTEIQRKSFYPIEQSKDIVMGSETGSGKTLAYLVPLIASKLSEKLKGQVVVILPNDDLGVQVGQVVSQLCEGTFMSCYVLTKQALLRAALPSSRSDVVITTAATALAAMESPAKFVRDVTAVVIDEVDAIVTSAFDIQSAASSPAPIAKLVKRLCTPPKPKRRGKSAPQYKQPQFVFVGATLQGGRYSSMVGFLKRYFPDAQWVTSMHLHKAVENLDQVFIKVRPYGRGRERVLLEQLEDNKEQWSKALVITNSVSAATRVHRLLIESTNFTTGLYHKQMDLSTRLQLQDHFKGGQLHVLVCSQLGGRGIDFPEVDLVLQYQLPRTLREYLHRVGRTARMGKAGMAISLFATEDTPLIEQIQKAENKGEVYLSWEYNPGTPEQKEVRPTKSEPRGMYFNS